MNEGHQSNEDRHLKRDEPRERAEVSARQSLTSAVWMTVTAGAAAMTTAILLAEKTPEWTTIASVIIVTSMMIALMIARIVVVARAHPRPLTIALLGFPNTGKTVYLSVLYHELIAREHEGMRFLPYGMETTERVNEAMNRLNRGEWLPRTDVKEVFFHRIKASDGAGIFARRFKIEVPDFAGEHIAELAEKDDSGTRWLHRTAYFRFAVESDAVFLCIDCKVLLDQGPALQEQQGSLMAAMQVLMDAKGVSPPKKMEMPVALLLLKDDLVRTNLPNDLLTDPLHQLIEFLRSHCLKFKVFRVAAVGDTEYGSPRRGFRPTNVVEPILWAVKRV